MGFERIAAYIVLLGILYIFLIYLLTQYKKISIKESKAFVKELFFKVVSYSSGNLQLLQGDIADILSAIAKFSSINAEHTKWEMNCFASIPNFCVEIYDSDFLSYFDVIRANIGNIFERMFAYHSLNGLYFITYERTLNQNLYQVVGILGNHAQIKKGIAAEMPEHCRLRKAHGDGKGFSLH